MLKFRDIGLSIKITLVVLVPYSLGIVVAGISGYLSYVNAGLLGEYQTQTQAVKRAATMSTEAAQLRETFYRFLSTRDKAVLAKYDTQLKRMRDHLAALSKDVVKGSAESKMLIEAQKALDDWQKSVVKPAIEKLETDPAGGEKPNVAFGPDTDRQLGKFSTLIGKIAQERESSSEQPIHRAKWNSELVAKILLYGMVVIAATAIILIFVVARRIVRPIRQAVALAEATSTGDLTQKLNLEGSDEVGRLGSALDTMVETLRNQSREILEAVNILSTSAAEISTTVSQVARNTSTTSTSVTQTTTTVQEVKHSASMASEKSKDVARMAQESVRVSSEGKTATEETVERMNLIKEQMESVGETVVRLSEHSRAIEDIIVTVQDLADQSNLLAVNASIEAARAGDQGKGFAVVAHEIKSLADQSKEATEQIRAILEDTRKWVSAVVMATEQGSKAVDRGVEQSMKAGESIATLSRCVEESAQAASVIQASSDQQFTGVDQVSHAMTGIEQAMQQNLNGNQQLEESAQKLADLGNQLKDLVAQYRI